MPERRKRKPKANNPTGLGDFDDGTNRLSKSVTLANNRMKGRMAEDGFALEQTIQGKEVKRIHVGGDFVVQDRDMFGRKVGKRKTYEIKSGTNARLSKAQKRTKRQLGKDFKEIRES